MKSIRGFSLLIPLALVTAAMVPDRETAEQTNRASPSLVSRVLRNYEPTADAGRTADAMAAAANRLLESLTAELRAQVQHPLNSAERSEWTNVPPRGNEAGLRLGDCDEAQVQRALDLLATTLSDRGYDKVRAILLGDDELLPNGQPRRGFGAENYWLLLFGTPSAEAPWGLQLDGHHLALNLSFQGDRMSMSPTFFGAQPSRFELGPEEFVPLAGEVGRAFDLLATLADEQVEEAVVSPRRGRNVAAAGKDGFVPDPEGLRCDSLDEAQRGALTALLQEAIAALPEPHATRRLQALSAQIDELHFAWSGPRQPGSDISYRLQGPRLILEFACQDLGGDPLDHLHLMVRDPANEYGSALSSGEPSRER